MKKVFSILVVIILTLSLSAPVLPNTRPCNGCSGQGRNVCHVCRGTGVERELVRRDMTGDITARERMQGGVREIPCRACSGGSFRTCAVCRGSGQIPGGATGGNQGVNQGRSPTTQTPVSQRDTYPGTSIRTFPSVSTISGIRARTDGGQYVYSFPRGTAPGSYLGYLRKLGLSEKKEGNRYTYTKGGKVVITVAHTDNNQKTTNQPNQLKIYVFPVARELFPPAAQATQRPAQQAQRPAAQQAQRPQAQQAQRPAAQQAQRPAAQTAQKPAAQQAAPLRVVSQPQSQTVKEGQLSFFTVAVQSTASRTTATQTFQWQMKRRGESSFSPIAEAGGFSGTKRNALRIDKTQAALNGAQFRCVVTDAGKSVTSNAATLTVTRP